MKAFAERIIEKDSITDRNLRAKTEGRAVSLMASEQLRLNPSIDPDNLQSSNDWYKNKTKEILTAIQETKTIQEMREVAQKYNSTVRWMATLEYDVSEIDAAVKNKSKNIK